MGLKEKWTNLPLWSKGGLIGVVIGLIISIIGAFLIHFYEGLNTTTFLLSDLLGILACFIPGAIIGLFIQKIKKASKKSLFYFALLGGIFGLFLYLILSAVIGFLEEELITWRYALVLFAPEFVDKIFNLIIHPFCTLTTERGESQAFCIFFIGHITNIIIYALIFVIIGILIKKFKR